jgi:hypothetical protein
MKSLASLSANAAVAIVFAGLGPSVAEAQQTVFRQVRIDVSAIPAGAAFARRDLSNCLSRFIPQSFAGRIVPSALNAPVLVVRPTAVFLGPQTGGGWNGAGGGGGLFTNGMWNNDTMTGEALFGGKRVPLTVNAPPGFGGAALPEYDARLRTQQLCQNFAYWLARQI